MTHGIKRTNDFAGDNTVKKLINTPLVGRQQYRFYNNTAFTIYILEVVKGTALSGNDTNGNMVNGSRISIAPITPGSYCQSEADDNIDVYVTSTGAFTLGQIEEIY